MKKLILILALTPLLFTGCQIGYTFKDGTKLTGGFDPDPKQVKALTEAIQ